MAEEVRHAAREGYHWLKYHVDEVQNVVDQTVAMQDAAPAGFKVHYDFNANATFDAVAPIVRKLEKFPIAARIEDPIVASDVEGWKKIRAMTELEVLVHHGPVEFLVQGIVDGLIAGHAPIGEAAKIAAIAETNNLPIMRRNDQPGIPGPRGRHVQNGHARPLQPRPPVEGRCDAANAAARRRARPAADRRGLGVTLDRAKLQKYEAAKRPAAEPFLVRIQYRSGPTIYTRHDPDKPGATDQMRYLHRLIGKNAPVPAPGYDTPVLTEFWDDRNAPEFQKLWAATESGPVTRDLP